MFPEGRRCLAPPPPPGLRRGRESPFPRQSPQSRSAHAPPPSSRVPEEQVETGPVRVRSCACAQVGAGDALRGAWLFGEGRGWRPPVC